MTLGEVKEVGGEDARKREGEMVRYCASDVYICRVFVCFCANDTYRVKTIYIGRVSGTAL